jgi:hypothetical protein
MPQGGCDALEGREHDPTVSRQSQLAGSGGVGAYVDAHVHAVGFGQQQAGFYLDQVSDQ